MMLLLQARADFIDVREFSSHTGTMVTRGEYNENPLLNQEFRLMVSQRSIPPAIAA